ncbi:MAG: LptF/LptG family permease [Parachlamydiaceae bacterium]|nr:LptF/LptG family permease [Parachlamydiaceae bacterium]
MPILWQYLLRHYLRVLFLCTVAFIAVLLVMRLEEIARFATLGASALSVAGFVMHQIPYILPITIPIASLISSILLVQGLSTTHELTALRACGMAFKDILAPILVAAACLTLANFYIVSEVATNSHLSAGLLKSELRAINPLLLANNKHLMDLKGFYFEALGASRLGESAADVVLATPNKGSDRINLLLAKEMRTAPQMFFGSNVTLISSLGNNEGEKFDQLMLENIAEASISVQDFAQVIDKKVWTLNNDHLTLPLLLVRLDEERQNLIKGEQANLPQNELKQITRNINRGYSEIMRRVSLAFAVFSFTLLGAAFGVGISRNRSNRGLYFVICLTALYMIAFFAAKSMEHVLATAALIYFLPHILIVGLSIWALRRAAKGIAL